MTGATRGGSSPGSRGSRAPSRILKELSSLARFRVHSGIAIPTGGLGIGMAAPVGGGKITIVGIPTYGAGMTTTVAGIITIGAGTTTSGDVCSRRP